MFELLYMKKYKMSEIGFFLKIKGDNKCPFSSKLAGQGIVFFP